MICKPCRTKDHDNCVDIHLLGTGRNGCACQHRSGTFTTSTLNPDGTRTNGVFGATGSRGSALTQPVLAVQSTGLHIDPRENIKAAYEKIMGDPLIKPLLDQEHEYVEPDAPWGHRQTDKVWAETIESAVKESRD